MPHDDGTMATGRGPAGNLVCRLDETTRPWRLTVSGEIDLATVGDLAAALRRASRRGVPLLVDLREVTLCTATGFRELRRHRDTIAAVLVARSGSCTGC